MAQRSGRVLCQVCRGTRAAVFDGVDHRRCGIRMPKIGPLARDGYPTIIDNDIMIIDQRRLGQCHSALSTSGPSLILNGQYIIRFTQSTTPTTHISTWKRGQALKLSMDLEEERSRKDHERSDDHFFFFNLALPDPFVDRDAYIAWRKRRICARNGKLRKPYPIWLMPYWRILIIWMRLSSARIWLIRNKIGKVQSKF